MTIKAIETKYAGCRFRSRTEARWAVLFDALGIKWEYEKEGFELPSGWYLPDFWIPEWDAWIEIKGEEPTERERFLTYELTEALNQRTIIAIGTPDHEAKQFESYMMLGLSLAEHDGGFVLASSVGTWLDHIMPLPHKHVPPLEPKTAYVTPRIKAAITKARSARFEHGEKP